VSREEKARSVRAAVVKLAARDKSLSVNEYRIILAIERVVARLSQDRTLAKHLVYKGGFVLLKSLGSERFTRDLDAVGVGIEKDDVSKLVPVALGKDLDDGFWFGDVRIEPLDAQGEYGALRFSAAFQIGDPPTKKTLVAKLSRIHFDVGFGDAVPRKLPLSEMPMLLKGDEALTWRVYPPEYIFSEKLQTLVARASANSRAKDVHDLVMLYKECDAEVLRKAISQTFKRRETVIPPLFAEYARSLDTRVLASAWQSVQLGDSSVTFAETWKRMLTVLKKLDVVLDT
jgi:predicted nucleotidyltransferase component of viral defense system